MGMYGCVLGFAFFVDVLLVVVTQNPVAGLTLIVAAFAFGVFKVLRVPQVSRYSPTIDEKRRARRLNYAIVISRWAMNIFVVISIVAGILTIIH